MASINKAILIGNIGHDLEVKTSGSGVAILNFTLATSRRFKGSDGEVQTETEWHRICAFGRTAEVIGQYCRKGSSIYVEGRLRTREWEKDGVKRYTTEIIAENIQLLDKRADGDQSTANKPDASPAQSQPTNDDMPF